MAIDFKKDPGPDEGVKPHKHDFWKPPSPQVDLEKERAKLEAEQAEFAALKNQVEEKATAKTKTEVTPPKNGRGKKAVNESLGDRG